MDDEQDAWAAKDVNRLIERDPGDRVNVELEAFRSCGEP